MASSQAPFEAHMQAEVNTIVSLAGHPRTLKVGSAEVKATMATFDKREEGAIIKAGLTDIVPFLFNFDSEYEEGIWRDWPPIPGPVRWVILNVAKVMHPGRWKFASCDGGRRRKELYAVPE